MPDWISPDVPDDQWVSPDTPDDQLKKDTLATRASDFLDKYRAGEDVGLLPHEADFVDSINKLKQAENEAMGNKPLLLRQGEAITQLPGQIPGAWQKLKGMVSNWFSQPEPTEPPKEGGEDYQFMKSGRRTPKVQNDIGDFGETMIKEAPAAISKMDASLADIAASIVNSGLLVPGSQVPMMMLDMLPKTHPFIRNIQATNNALADYVNGQIHKSANEYAKMYGVDQNSFAAQLTDFLPWMVQFPGLELGTAADIDRAVQTGAKFVQQAQANAALAATKSAPVVKAATGVGLAHLAGAMGINIPAGIEDIIGAVGGQILPEGIFKSQAIADRVAAAILNTPTEDVATYARAIKQFPDIPVRQAVEKAMEQKASKLELAADDIRLRLKPDPGETLMVDAKAPDGSWLHDIDALPADQKKIRKYLDDAAQARARASIFQNRSNAEKIIDDLKLWAANTGAQVLQSSAVGAMFTGATSTEGKPDLATGAVLGALIGGPTAPFAAVKGMQYNRMVEGAKKLMARGAEVVNPDSMTGMHPGAQEFTLKIAGMADGMGVKTKVVDPEEMRIATNIQKGKSTPWGFYSPEAKTIYINREFPGAGAHEVVHPMQELFGQILGDTDPELFRQFTENYQSKSGQEMSPEAMQKEREAEAGRVLLEKTPVEAFYGGKKGFDLIREGFKKIFPPSDIPEVNPVLGAPISPADLEGMRGAFFKAGEMAAQPKSGIPDIAAPTTPEGPIPIISRGAPGEAEGVVPPAPARPEIDPQIIDDAVAAMKATGEPTDVARQRVMAAIDDLNAEGKPITLDDVARRAFQRNVPQTMEEMPGNIPDVKQPERGVIKKYQLMPGEFMPSGHPDAIKESAIKYPDGKVFTGFAHFDAQNKAQEHYTKSGLEDLKQFMQWVRNEQEGAGPVHGFVTNGQEFLDRNEALQRAIDQKQIAPTPPEGSEPWGLESHTFADEQARFPETDREYAKGQQMPSVGQAAIRTKDGFILTGEDAEAEGAKLGLNTKGAEQGFVNNHGQFVPKDLVDKKGNYDAEEFYNREGQFMPASDPRFYSQLAQVAEQKLPNKASAKQILATLKSNGVKDAELKWTLGDFLDRNPNPTKQELLDHINANQVQVQEKELGTPHPEGYFDDQPKTQELLDELEKAGVRTDVYNNGAAVNFFDKKTGQLLSGITPKASKEAQAVIDKFKDHMKTWRGQPAKYERDSLNLPGYTPGSYRELLLTLPESPPPLKWMATSKKGTRFTPEFNTREELEHWMNEAGSPDWGIAQLPSDFPNNKDYSSPHFSEPNIVAHMRIAEYHTPDGDPILVSNEFQSDWAQTIRKEGVVQPFTAQNTPDGWYDVRPDGTRYSGPYQNQAEAEAAARIHSEVGVPDMPFKSTDAWTSLSLKRLIQYAVDHGYDKIGWTTGEQQGERYDLSKHIHTLSWHYYPRKGNFDLDLALHNGRLTNLHDIAKGQLQNHVGKELAEKILNDPQIEQSENTTGKSAHGDIEGLDLKIGGEGMKSFYDNIIPKVARQIGKQFGARVGQEEILTNPTGFNDPKPYVHALGGKYEGKFVVKNKFGQTFQNFKNGEAEWANTFDDGMIFDNEDDAVRMWDDIENSHKKPTTIHTLEITPELANVAATKGFSMFMPSSHPDAIMSQAVMTPDGKIFTGPMHSTAAMKAKAAGYKLGTLTAGAIDNKGQFYNRQQAWEQAIKMGQNPGVGIRDIQGNRVMEGASFSRANGQLMPGIPVERYGTRPDAASNVSGPDSYFFAPRGQAMQDYGEYLTKAEISNDAKIFHGTSTHDFIEQNGLMDQKFPTISKLTKGEVDTPRDLVNLYMGMGPGNEYYDGMQAVAKEILQKQGYQGAHWTEEEDLSPEQYQVWDRSVIKGPKHFMPAANLGDIIKSHEAEGGSTTDLTTGQNQPDRYVFETHPDRTKVVDKLTIPILRSFIQENQDLLSKPGNFLGTWRNNGKDYLAISTGSNVLPRALSQAARAGQKAIYDMQDKKEIEAPTTPGRIGAPGLWDSTFVDGDGEAKRLELAKILNVPDDKHFYQQKPADRDKITSYFLGTGEAEFMPATEGNLHHSTIPDLGHFHPFVIPDLNKDRVSFSDGGVVPYDVTNYDWGKRMYEPNAPFIQNLDGSKSTHRMATATDENGTVWAFPTIVRDGGRLIQLEPQQAFEWNKARGEAIPFGKDFQAADAFARGGYKQGSPLEDRGY